MDKARAETMLEGKVDAGYVPAPPKVDAERVVPSKRPAPTLMIQFRCPECFSYYIKDAYAGVPSCQDGHRLTFLKAVRIMEGQ